MNMGRAIWVWAVVGWAAGWAAWPVGAHDVRPATRPAAQPAGAEAEDAAVELSPLVSRLLKDPLTTPAQRRAMLVFHGQWGELENPTSAERAAMALARFDLGNSALQNAATAPLLRARAALFRGEPEAALKLLEKDDAVQAALVRGQALADLGKGAEAVALLAPYRAKLRGQTIGEAADLVAYARVLVLLAGLEGRPAQDYELAMGLFGKARTELDRLYWPAALAEAQLLLDKDNAPDAAKALSEALTLNPRCGEAWYLLGRAAAERFDFDRAERCVTELRRANPQHPLARLLEARLRLVQRDPAGAKAALEPVLAQFPQQREALALLAASEALAYRDAAVQQALARFDQLSPRSGLALATVGQALSAARQYGAGEKILRQAIERQPNWPEPRVELGLLLMQAGAEAKAAVELRAAAALDPFNRQAGNQLKLAEELLQYRELRTRHFIVRYKPGIDEVMARDLADDLDRIYAKVTGAFAHRLSRPAVVEILPDEERFGVRITGMPEIWTIAACMGEVIAMTPPRAGPKQRGTFDWVRVLQHEFTHTVTLDQTDYRIAHWLTEACAVSQEPTPRDYEACQLLAAALAADKLFDLEQINWAFVRPKTELDRPLAYAQAHWMLEYLTTRFGKPALLKLLALSKQGLPEAQAIEQATGQAPAAFLAGFKSWAKEQVKQWGLGPHTGDGDPRVKAVLKEGQPKAAAVTALLAKHPEHPELLRLAAGQALAAGEAAKARELVRRYAKARPVDPWADQALVRLAVQVGRLEEAADALSRLDQQETRSGDWAAQLARLHRGAGRLDEAARWATRALQREPYNATLRELAAAIAMQRGDLTMARRQIGAMTMLEPDQALHFARLAAVLRKLGQAEAAEAAAAKAKQLDVQAGAGRSE